MLAPALVTATGVQVRRSVEDSSVRSVEVRDGGWTQVTVGAKPPLPASEKKMTGAGGASVLVGSRSTAVLSDDWT